MADNRRELREELAALGRLMADPAGRRWLQRVLTACHVYDTSFGTNALRMAFNEGERNVGLQLIAEAMQANADMFLQMLKENNRERPRKPDTDDAGTDPDATANPDA